MEPEMVGLFKFTVINLPENVYNTFFYLNQSDVYGKSSSQTLLIQYGDNLEKQFYTSLGVFVAAVPAGCVGATPVMAQRLGLQQNDNVFVNFCGSTKSLRIVTVRPKTTSDYSVLANVHSLLEIVMMDQVRVVAPRQKLPLKVGNIVIELVVDNITPNAEFGCLEKYTEVVVLDPESESNDEHNFSYGELASVNPVTDIVWRLYQWGLKMWNPTQNDNNPTQTKNVPTKENILAAFRKHEKNNFEFRVVLEENLLEGVDVVYTNCGFSKVPKPCRIVKMPERTSLTNTSDVNNDDKVLYSLVSNRCSSEVNNPEVNLSYSQIKHLDVTVGSRVKIVEIKELPENTNIELKTKLCRNEVFLWPSIDVIYNDIVKSVNYLHENIDCNSLITGPTGCGKTYLLKKVALYCEDHNIFSSKFDCKNVRGKTIDNLMKLLSMKLSECAYRDPSVLFLDDLDALMFVHEGDESSGISGTYCKRLSMLITELYECFANNSRICLIATASSVASLGPLSSSRGPRLFSLVVKIPEMSSEERKLMISKLGVVITDDILEKTQGYRIQDLCDLAGRVKLKALVAERQVCAEDVRSALEDTTPIALHGVALKADVPYRWTDVGGMSEVKSVLEEIFRWPSLHPEVFACCPLTLQTGALLYGAPGCGKTLIAGALANECGMNFISVKGPELLSKYIGASEAAVRNVFERAQQAKPCLLFFDELDSLAPKRGADSTGVTDRVVNQMLTELDGVEGRDGVWVLGASSRPDLIDPALLRPGRLDRAVYCPLPSQDERLRILKVSKDICFDESVSLEVLAGQTEGFSGADLQALLYNAQMEAVKEIPNQNDDIDVIVKHHHVTSALEVTKPSLTKLDLAKYEKIFLRFQVRKRVKEGGATIAEPQKVTFA